MNMADPFQSPQQIKPEQILDILIRGKWLIIIPLCISLTLGLVKTLTSDKTYEASTSILVQAQRVPTNYVKSVVTSSTSQRISTISQQILSRSNLEKIITRFGLFKKAENMYIEDKIAAMREKIKVKLERARRGSEAAFSISYSGNDPQRVMQIANTLASYFMDENLKVREAQAVGTSEFLDFELGKTRKRLEEREQRLAAYRAKHLGGLPDELESNLRTLDRLQQQMSEKSNLLREARNAVNMIEKQMAQAKEMASQNFGDPFGELDLEGENGLGGSENAQKLAAVKNAYENMLLRYKEKHPDVIKLKKTMEKLEKAIAEEEKLSEEEGDGDLFAPDSGMPDFAAVQQETQLNELKNEVGKLQSEIFKIEKKMKLYQQRVEDTPKRELELQSLKRDYSNIQDIFNSLLDRKLEAELSVNMEKKQKGEQFRILDHARVPEKPTSPNVKLLFLFSIILGLGTGCGILFVKEVINFSVIRRNHQIEEILGLNILSSIPPLENKSEKMKKRFKWAAFAGCCLYASLFLGFFAVLNYKGLDRTIAFIKMYINI